MSAIPLDVSRVPFAGHAVDWSACRRSVIAALRASGRASYASNAQWPHEGIIVRDLTRPWRRIDTPSASRHTRTSTIEVNLSQFGVYANAQTSFRASSTAD